MKCRMSKLKRSNQFLTPRQRNLTDAFAKAVDKVGRAARRTIDTHIKNVFSKPRIATAMRRMTALFNFSLDLRMLAVLFL